MSHRSVAGAAWLRAINTVMQLVSRESHAGTNRLLRNQLAKLLESREIPSPPILAQLHRDLHSRLVRETQGLVEFKLAVIHGRCRMSSHSRAFDAL